MTTTLDPAPVPVVRKQRRRRRRFIEFSDEYPTGRLIVTGLGNPRQPSPEAMAQHEAAIRAWCEEHHWSEAEALASALEVD